MVFLKIEKEHDDKPYDEDKETAEKNCDRWKQMKMNQTVSPQKKCCWNGEIEAVGTWD